MRVVEVMDGGERSRICAEILRTVPEWFGIESATRAYIDGVAELPTFVALADDGREVGFLALKQHGHRAAALAVELLDGVLPEPSFTPQVGEPTYAAKIEAADRELDLTRPQESLNRIRALSPHIGARGELHGRRVTIWRARVEDGELVPLEVQPEGGRRMAYDAFVRGLR